MRILKLAANMPTFRTVSFNRSGLSIITGSKKTAEENPRNRTRTYNAVGKSLMIELIHYCLGSNENDAFKKYLPEWAFSLTVEAGGAVRTITRPVGKTRDITLDGEKVGLTALKKWLYEVAFAANLQPKGVTFRSLIAPFARSGRAAYERFDKADEGDAFSPYPPMLRAAYLLGLDLGLAEQKHKLRTQQRKLEDTVEHLEKDPLFAELFAEDKAGIELAELRDEEARLQGDLNAFRVAENYRAVQEEANTIKRALDLSRRELVKTSDGIEQIDRSLQTRGDLDPRTVTRLYEEAQAALPERVQRRIEEVLAFQHELKSRRILRLSTDRQSLVSRHKQLESDVSTAAAQLEEKLRYLGTHVALDEYLVTNQRLNDVRQRMAKLEASQEQRERVSRELKRIALDLTRESISTDEYLTASAELVSEANATFRSYTKRLYGGRASGLSITNDDGQNLTRYKIEAHIAADAAEGINEAKIFCFDLTTLLLRRRHSIEFLIHDSTLFQAIDHRQRWTMFSVVDQVCRQHDVQYIATLNEHDLTSMVPSTAEEQREFERVFSENARVLKLTDGSSTERLLGIEIDMNYRTNSKTRPVDDFDE